LNPKRQLNVPITYLFSLRSLKRSSNSLILSCSEDVETTDLLGSNSHLARALAVYSKKRGYRNTTKENKRNTFPINKSKPRDMEVTDEITASMHVGIIFKLKDMTLCLLVGEIEPRRFI
jgi:hypothetical protein